MSTTLLEYICKEEACIVRIAGEGFVGLFFLGVLTMLVLLFLAVGINSIIKR